MTAVEVRAPQATAVEELVWTLYDDVGRRLRERPAFTYLLDHALLGAELRRVWGSGCGAADPMESATAALRALPREPEAGPWLYRGAAQAGWVLLQVCRATGRAAPRLDPLDEVIDRWLTDYPGDADLDLPRGILGIGVYALNHPDAGLRGAMTRRILEILDRRLERDVVGAFLRVPDSAAHRQEGSSGCRMLGAAHGTAGVMSFLASVLAHARRAEDHATAERASALLDRTGAWLAAQGGSPAPGPPPPGGTGWDAGADTGSDDGSDHGPDDGSDTGQWRGHFRHRVELAQATIKPTWCSGDPGVAAAFDVVHAVTGDPGAARWSHRIADHVTRQSRTRTSTSFWGVVDGCLCHGAAGLVWYASRLGQAGRPLGERWTRWLVEQRREGPLTYFSPRGMVRDVSFLEGDVGVALALLTHLTGSPAVWEELLLARPVGLRAAEIAGGGIGERG